MTGYTPAELAQDWEFKILRSSTSVFRNPERFREAVEQEARAGWVLIEKFDNQRLRFKRPVSARSGDAALADSGGGGGGGFDPYRTTYGISETRLAITIAVSIITMIGVAITIIVLSTRGGGTP